MATARERGAETTGTIVVPTTRQFRAPRLQRARGDALPWRRATASYGHQSASRARLVALRVYAGRAVRAGRADRGMPLRLDRRRHGNAPSVADAARLAVVFRGVRGLMAMVLTCGGGSNTKFCRCRPF
jgi:hypothetical protein